MTLQRGNPGNKGNSRAGLHVKFRAVFDKYLTEERYLRACEVWYKMAVDDGNPQLMVKLQEYCLGKPCGELEEADPAETQARWDAMVNRIREQVRQEERQALVSNVAAPEAAVEPKPPTIQ